jgi:hypothetical protein
MKGLVTILATGIITGFFLSRNRYFIVKYAKPGKKVATIAHVASKGNLDEKIIEVMLTSMTTETVGLYRVDEETIQDAGFELAKYGSPESCFLAMHLSNYSGVKYPESTNEIIREAACMFLSYPDSSSVARIIEIVRGKYLFEDVISTEVQQPKQEEKEDGDLRRDDFGDYESL